MSLSWSWEAREPLLVSFPLFHGPGKLGAGTPTEVHREAYTQRCTQGGIYPEVYTGYTQGCTQGGIPKGVH